MKVWPDATAAPPTAEGATVTPGQVELLRHRLEQCSFIPRVQREKTHSAFIDRTLQNGYATSMVFTSQNPILLDESWTVSNVFIPQKMPNYAI